MSSYKELDVEQAEGSLSPLPFFIDPVKVYDENYQSGENIDYSDYKSWNPFSGYHENSYRESTPHVRKTFPTNKGGSEKFPNQSIDFGKYSLEANKYASRLISSGWGAPLPKESFLRRHIAFSKTKLDIWEDHTQGCKVINKEEVLYRSLIDGPDFAKYIKKARQYNHIKQFSVIEMDFDDMYIFEDWDHADSLPACDDLIFWTESSEDYEWMFTELDIQKSSIDAFKYHFKRHIEYMKVPKEKIISSLTVNLEDCKKNSKMFVPGSDRTEYNKYLIDDDKETVEEGYYGKRTLIQVGPANARDVVIPDLDTKLKVRQLDQLFECFSIPDKWCLCGKGINKAARIKSLLRCNLFIHLDLKKEGLTFPRYLIKAAAEVIEDYYNVRLDNIKDFEDLFVEIDGTTYKTRRGRSLGWGNQMCSVILSCLIQAFLWKLNEASEKYFGVVYTDDIIIGTFTTDERYQSLHSVEIIALLNDFLGKYGFIVSYKKCYASKCATILGQTYSKETENLFRDKWGRVRELQPHPKTYSESDKWRMFAKAKHARNHAEAKDYVNAALIAFTINTQDAYEYAMSIAEDWGQEFEDGPDEWSIPYRGGGWYTPIDENLDASYDNEEHLGLIASFREMEPIIISIPREDKIKPNLIRRRKRIERAYFRELNENEDIKEGFAEADPAFISMMSSGEMKDIEDLKGTAFWNAHRLFCETFNCLSNTIGAHVVSSKRNRRGIG
jgi:hypothetical protein